MSTKRSIEGICNNVFKKIRGNGGGSSDENGTGISRDSRDIGDIFFEEIGDSISSYPVPGGVIPALNLSLAAIKNSHVLELGRVPYVNIIAPKVSMGEFIRAKKTSRMTKSQAIKTRIISHDEFRLNKTGREWKDSLVIVDEVHIFTQKKFKALQKSGAKYFVLLSATPTPNKPSEIVPMINILYIPRIKGRR